MYRRCGIPDNVYLTPEHLLVVYRNTDVYQLMLALKQSQELQVFSGGMWTNAAVRIAQRLPGVELSPMRTETSAGIPKDIHKESTQCLEKLQGNRGVRLFSDINVRRDVRLDDYPMFVYRADAGNVERQSADESWAVPLIRRSSTGLGAAYMSSMDFFNPFGSLLQVGAGAANTRFLIGQVELRLNSYSYYRISGSSSSLRCTATCVLVFLFCKSGRRSDLQVVELLSAYGYAEANRRTEEYVRRPIDVDKATLQYLAAKHQFTVDRKYEKGTLPPQEVYFNRRQLTTIELQLAANMEIREV